MASVFMAALFALTAPHEASAQAAPAPLDVSCYRLMAELAADEDPRISSAGLTGAQYFLGRIDARAPGFDPDSDAQTQPASGTREQLIAQCSAEMATGARDLRAIRDRLATAPASEPTI